MNDDALTETFTGPAAIIINGCRITTEREYTSVSDVRQTPIGPIDFGYAILGPIRLVRTKVDG